MCRRRRIACHHLLFFPENPSGVGPPAITDPVLTEEIWKTRRWMDLAAGGETWARVVKRREGLDGVRRRNGRRGCAGEEWTDLGTVDGLGRGW